MPRPLMLARFKLFQAIEWLLERKKTNVSGELKHYFPDSSNSANASYIWVYASTIGELHAIQPLLIELLEINGSNELVILTDHPHYTNAFLKAFPKAYVVDHGLSGKIENEIELYPPLMFFLAEIPCLLFDAPCRFAYRVIFELKKRAVSIIAINGWLYGEAPSCRMDLIEKRLFGQDYLEAIDLFLVQTNEVREQLIAAGVEIKKIEVTGNIKFDSVFADEASLEPHRSLKPFMDSLKASGRPTVVAGCITNISEQEYVLDAFAEVIEKIPNALLVLAPRHPENIERMAQLSLLIQERRLSFILRSEFSEGCFGQTSVIVLDTMGELRHLYAASDVCIVGLNHNVLEPLALDKPVLVNNGWKKVYPSYPVYQQAKKIGLIVEPQSCIELAERLVEYLERSASEIKNGAREKLIGLSGATKKNLALIKKTFGI